MDPDTLNLSLFAKIASSGCTECITVSRVVVEAGLFRLTGLGPTSLAGAPPKPNGHNTTGPAVSELRLATNKKSREATLTSNKQTRRLVT